MNVNGVMLEAKLRLLLHRVVLQEGANHPLAVKIRQRITDLQLTDIDKEQQILVESDGDEDWSKDADDKTKDFWRDLGASEEAA